MPRYRLDTHTCSYVMKLFIAANARSLELTLGSNNTSEFGCVPNLAADRRFGVRLRGEVFLGLGEGELFHFDAVVDDPFDPTLQVGLAMQAGEESRPRGQIAGNRKGTWLGTSNADRRLPS